jgi:multiple sugar transport system permease protein
VEVWKQFRGALFNSIVTALAATILCVAMSALGGYAFTRLDFPGRRVLFIAVVATLAIPGYAVLIPLYRLMIGAHMVDTYLGVTLIYISAFLPLSLWLMRSVFESLPVSLEEAAQIDGAGRLYIFFRIVLPLVGPGLTAAAILTFLGAWGQYLVPLIFSPTVTKPLTVLIPEFATKNFIDYGLITAAGSIAIVIPALVVIFLNRYLVTGLLAGSVK